MGTSSIIAAKTTGTIAAAVVGLGLLTGPASFAQAPTPAPAAKSVVDDLTPEEKAERESRKACKVEICKAMRQQKASADVKCDIIKTWRKEQLDKMVSKSGASWPWGKVACKAPIHLAKEMLEKSLAPGKYEATLATHHVHCEVDRKEGNADIKFEFTPKVSFENGKAVKATLNWGKIEAPTLVKGAMWTATATDNTFNVLQGTVVEDINDFTTVKCDEVKDEWEKK